MKPKVLFFALFYAFFGALAAQAETRTITADSKASISPILELSISQQGQSELKFGNIRPSAIETVQAGPVTIIVQVNSNSGERYQVTQAVGSELSNADGETIPSSNLQFKTSSAHGGFPISTLTPVSDASQIIYTSDTAGNSDTISAEYTLSVPESQAPGDYSGLLTYTVSSL